MTALIESPEATDLTGYEFDLPCDGEHGQVARWVLAVAASPCGCVGVRHHLICDGCKSDLHDHEGTSMSCRVCEQYTGTLGSLILSIVPIGGVA